MRIPTPTNTRLFTNALDWHKHPFAVPIITLFALLCAAFGSFLFLGGETIGASDAKVVHLHIDGRSQAIPTRAQTVGEVLSRSGIELREGDIAEPALDSVIVEDDFNINIYRAKPVTVIDDKGQRITAKIAESDPEAIAKKAGISTFPEDKVGMAPPDEALKDGVLGAKVVIKRATPAYINLYGNSIPARTHATTVGELLAEKGIKAGEGDTIQPSPDTLLSENAQVFVTRFGKQISSVEEAIPAPEEKINDPNTPAGQKTVKEPGAPGKKIVTYEVELKNGKEVSRKPIQEVVALQPVKRVVTQGTKVVISNPSANVEIGQRLAAARGWTGGEFYCLYQLWQKESKWNHLANNRSSGAYGIPQALPGSKMGTVAPDWQTNPETQITWGLGYIARSYKTPCGAWAKSQASGWY